ncbi:MAG: hypothetical protein SPF60_05310 [Lachnospiraceae bacterium]|nr:hypothetical protein [Lachnospiraceae bacterium]
MNTFTIVLFVIALVLLAAFIAMYFFTKKMEKKQDEQRAQMDAMAQSMTMLIIDKKKIRLKDSGLPQAVIEQTPKFLRRSKVAIVKAKVGPRMMTLMCDDAIFEQVPVKKEVKAIVSGIYITAVKGLRGSIEVPEPKKKGFFARMKQKAADKNKK